MNADSMGQLGTSLLHPGYPVAWPQAAFPVKRLPLLGMFDKGFRASYNDARRWTIMTHWMEPEFLEIVRRKGI